MPALLADLFPFLYALCFLALLWQAFRIMSRGFKAASGLLERPPIVAASGGRGDRTGRLTIHPELLDSEGRLTQDDLLTVRFSADQDPPLSPSDAQP